MDAQVRVSVVRNGRIVDERRVRAGEAMTIGGRGKLALPPWLAPQLPPGAPLFEHRDGHLRVRGVAGARGVYARGGERPQVLADGEEVVLDSRAKGYLDLAGARLLFQVEPARVDAPKPVLPPEVRRAPPSPQARRFTVALTAVLVVELAAIAYVHSRPPIDADGNPPPEFATGFSKATIVRPPVVVPPPPAIRKLKENQQVVDAPSKPKATPAQAREAAKNSDLVRALERMRKDERFMTTLFSRAKDGEVGAALDQVKPRPEYVAFGKPLAARPFTPEVVRIGAIGGELGGERATTQPTLPQPPKAPRPPVVTAQPCEPGDPTCDPAAPAVQTEDLRGPLAREMKGRLKAVQQCYEDAMRRHGGGMAGRMTLHFFVGTNGRVTDAEIEETLSGGVEDVGRCVVNRARDWKFGVRPKVPLEVSFPLILTQGG